MTLEEAAPALGCNSPSTPLSFRGISIDSRTLEPGSLFFAIQGENFDGHTFIEEAIKKGAVGVVAHRPLAISAPVLQVSDTTLALGKLAHAWRKKFSIPLLAVTGSNGKTTTKGFLKEIAIAHLQSETAVLASSGNLNNAWGLPLTLFQLSADHRLAIVELGMNHPGEIKTLTELCEPNVATITLAAAAHLQGLGTVEQVARAKGEIFEGLAANGVAVINADDPFAPLWRDLAGNRRILHFGVHAPAEICAEDLDLQKDYTVFTLKTPKGNLSVRLLLPGQHNVHNALAAAASAFAIDIPLTAIAQGLERMQAVSGRLERKKSSSGALIIDDTYNANPSSMRAAITSLARFPGQRILVVGDMRELGENAREHHRDCGLFAKDQGIDWIFSYGDLSEEMSQVFEKQGFHFQQQEELIHAIRAYVRADSTILVKGSRSMQMEKVVAALL